jgi:DNA invertase Pin-like site-specific DNA recombinase
MPNATEFRQHISAGLAQEERRLISERTRVALAGAKKRGRRLGANGVKLAAVNRQLADEFAVTIRDSVQAIGIEKSYSETARKLNEQGLRTRTGRPFHAQTVKIVALRVWK